MRLESLTLRSIRARAVLLKLKRPIVARIATIPNWSIILIDLLTEEGVVGRSYLEPYTAKAMRYLIPALHDFSDLLKGRRVAPVELHEIARKSLHFVGYQGLAMIAVSGLDMAAWDALAKAAGLPLCVFLGGTVGPVKATTAMGFGSGTRNRSPKRRLDCAMREVSPLSNFGLGGRMREMISEPSTLFGSRSAMRFV
jgi:mandelate racemase